MTKIDEHAIVPQVDDEVRAKLASALDVDGVVSALLFGSQADGTAGPLSDVDVAVWLEPDIPRGEYHDWQLSLMGLASAALGTNEVQVVILNGAPPLLTHRAIRDGVRLLERDRINRVRLETRAILDYLDTAPLRATLAAGVKRRIEEGRFGRR